MIALVLPMRIEAESLLAALEDSEVEQGPGRKYALGRLSGRNVGVFCCGVGKQSVDEWLAWIRARLAPSAYIVAGTAGALTPTLGIGDVVIGTSFHAEDAPAIAAVHRVDWSTNSPLSLPVRRGPIFTANEVLVNPTSRDALFRETGCLCVDMETYHAASFLQARELPFFAMRVVSDRANGNTRADFRSNITTARECLARGLALLVEASDD